MKAMTREQLQMIPTVDDLLQVKLALASEIDGLKKSILLLREELATTGLVKAKRTFCTPKELAAKVGVSQRTVITWLTTGIIKGSQPNGFKSSWIIPMSECERIEAEALDAQVTVKQYARKL
jgi:hypothetical protein